MKKYYTIILSVLFFVVAYINNWYADQLLDSLFVLYIIPIAILMIAFNYLLLISLIRIFRDKQYMNIASVVILIISVILCVYFPFREAKVRIELNMYEEERLEIIDLIKKDELIAKDENGNIELPRKYKKYSTSGEITIYQNNNDGQVIAFWVFRGMQSGSVQLIYSTGGKELIKNNEKGHHITNIEKLKDNWYLVYTEY